MKPVTEIRACARSHIQSGVADRASFVLELAGKRRVLSVVANSDPRARREAQAVQLRGLIADHFPADRGLSPTQRLQMKSKVKRLADRLVDDARFDGRSSLTVSDLDWILSKIEPVGSNVHAIEAALRDLDPPEAPRGTSAAMDALACLQRAVDRADASIRRRKPLIAALVLEERLREPDADVPPIVPGSLSSSDILAFLSAVPHADPPSGLIESVCCKGFFAALREDRSEAVRDAVIDFVNDMKLELDGINEAAAASTGLGTTVALMMLNLNESHLQSLVVTHEQCDSLFRSAYMLLGELHMHSTGERSALTEGIGMEGIIGNVNGLGGYAKKFMATERGFAIAQRLAHALTILRHNADRLETFTRSRHARDAALEGAEIPALLDAYVPARYPDAARIDFQSVGAAPAALTYIPQGLVEPTAKAAVPAPMEQKRPPIPPLRSGQEAGRASAAKLVVIHANADGPAHGSEPTVAELERIFTEAKPMRPSAQPGSRRPQPAKHHHNSQFGGIVPKARVAERTDAREMVRLGLFGLRKWGVGVGEVLRRLADARAERSGSQQLVRPPTLDNPPNNRRMHRTGAPVDR